MTTNPLGLQTIPDPYYGRRGVSVATPLEAVAVTPSDDSPLPFVARQIWVGTAGDLAVVFQGNATPVTLVGVPAGTLLNIAVKQVMTTNTTAGSLVAMV